MWMMKFQNAFVVDLDDLHDANEELAEAVRQNTRRYTTMVSDVVYEMLPDFKHREVTTNSRLAIKQIQVTDDIINQF